MGIKSSNIKERILQLLEIKGVAKSTFFGKIGMTYGNFTGKSKNTPLNSEAIADIFSIFPDVNLEWLLTGKGSMLRVSMEPNEQLAGSAEVAKKDEEIQWLKKQLGDSMSMNKNLTEANKMLAAKVEVGDKKNLRDEVFR
jgi:hypothetical protein